MWDTDKVVLAGVSPQSEETPLLGLSVYLKIILFSPLSKPPCPTVFFCSDRATSPGSRLDSPALPLRAPLFILDGNFILLLCKAQFSSWILPPASSHDLGESPVQISKPKLGFPGTRWIRKNKHQSPTSPREQHLVLPAWLMPMGTWAQWCLNF